MLSTEVRIDPEVIAQGASELSSIRSALPSGQLPDVAELGDRTVGTALRHLQDWWTAMNAGTAKDVRALTLTVEAVTIAQVARDRDAAVSLSRIG